MTSGNVATWVVRDGSRTTVRLELDGSLVGLATVSTERDAHRVQFSIGHGGIPRAVRSNLVDAAFRALPAQDGAKLKISVPLGDPDLLSDITSRARSVHAHAAGSTCLIDATLDGPTDTA